jgi:hypothetical protein
LTISTTTRRAGPYVGNGSQTDFAYAFKIFTTADLVVTQADDEGNETVLALTTDYTATMNADQDASPGGEVTLNAALDTDYLLTITSNVSALQSVAVTNNGGFFASVFNGVFDKLTILIQQLAEQLGRTFRIPVTNDTVTDFNIPVTGSGVLQWNADGTALEAVTLPDLSLSLALPSMTGNSGKALTNDGSTASWGAFAPEARTLTAGGLISGGGDLSANRTFTVTAATVAQVLGKALNTVVVTPSVLAGANAYQVLVDAATVAWDALLGWNAEVTLGGNRTMGTPTGLSDGEAYVLETIQDGTGSRTLAFPAIFDFGVEGNRTLSTGAGKRDIFVFRYHAGSNKLRLIGFSKSA